jgi:hypothetical protein
VSGPETWVTDRKGLTHAPAFASAILAQAIAEPTPLDPTKRIAPVQPALWTTDKPGKARHKGALIDILIDTRRMLYIMIAIGA